MAAGGPRGQRAAAAGEACAPADSAGVASAVEALAEADSEVAVAVGAKATDAIRDADEI